MAKVVTDSSNYYDIADAIRAKIKTDDTFMPGEMAAAISQIGVPVMSGSLITSQAVYQFVDHNADSGRYVFLWWTDGDPSVGEVYGARSYSGIAYFNENGLELTPFSSGNTWMGWSVYNSITGGRGGNASMASDSTRNRIHFALNSVWYEKEMNWILFDLE